MLLTFGTAESAVTIIAVSIPILRALLYMSTTPPKPRFFQELYDEGPSNKHQLEPLPHFESTIELVTLQNHEPEWSGHIDGVMAMSGKEHGPLPFPPLKERV